MLEAGWCKVYHPRAAVLHAHDYGAIEFMRRYFDEYRGLRETTGHVEPLAPVRARGTSCGLWPPTAAGWPSGACDAGTQARWTARSARPPRRPARVLGARLARRAAAGGGAAAAISLESRSDSPDAGTGRQRRLPRLPPAKAVPSKLSGEVYDVVARIVARRARAAAAPGARHGRARAAADRDADPARSAAAAAATTCCCRSCARLERRGHTCSVWLVDHYGNAAADWPAVLREEIREFFAPIEAPVYKGFAEWQGADVVIATGWQTVHAMLAARPVPRARLHRQRPRAGVLLDLDRVRAERRDLPLRHALHRRQPVAARPVGRPLRRERGVLRARRRPRRVSPTAGPAPHRHGRSTTPATRRRGGRSRWG